LRPAASQNAENNRIVHLRADQQAEVSLREQENLLNLTHDAIFVRDMNGIVRYWNRGAEELYGWPAKQVVGGVIHELLHTSVDAMKDADGKRELIVKSQRAENQHLMVSVSDTGVGLPSQQAEQIFNAFFTTKPHGTGMGLRISRSIVESHGVRLWADDNSPRGANFYFTLPTKGEVNA
jgi:nitrogen fixation/metabolism regulation signal transduction histidine kinase